MINIDLHIISKLKPCQERLNNYKIHYVDFKGSIIEFLKLEHISYSDKRWVAIRTLPKPLLKDWSILCAESVLFFYEQKHNDLTIREQLTILKSHRNLSRIELRNCCRIINTQRNTAYGTAAYTAAAYAADAAAYAAANAYANAAYAAANAYANAAYAAAYTAAANAKNLQQQANLNLLIKAIESNS